MPHVVKVTVLNPLRDREETHKLAEDYKKRLVDLFGSESIAFFNHEEHYRRHQPPASLWRTYNLQAAIDVKREHGLLPSENPIYKVEVIQIDTNPSTTGPII